MNTNATQPSRQLEDRQRLLGDALSIPRRFASVPPNLCLNWQRVDMPELQIDPPRRALPSPSSYPGEAAGEARVGRNGCGRMKTHWDQLLAHLPSPPHLPSTSPFSFLLFIYLFILNEHVLLCCTRVHEMAVSTSHCFYVICLFFSSLTGEQRPAVSDGGDLPFRVSC